MPAWNEARRLSSAMSSTAAKKDDIGDDNPAVEMLRDWFRHIHKGYNPENHRCIFSGVNCSGKTTSGYIPSFGTIWKCEGHRDDYDEIKTTFEGAE